MELLPATDPEVRALDAEEAAIRQAEAAYRADPELARDLEQSGWFAERTEAAKRGEAIRSEGQRQAPPVLQLPVQPGQVPFKPSAWAGFTNLLADVAQRRVALLEARRPEILAAIAAREEQLRVQVLDSRVRDVGGLVAEANQLLASATAARGPLPRTVRTSAGLAPPRYREATDELELVDAALGGWSLLDPIVSDEPTSLVTSTYGIQADRGPTPANGRDQVRYGTSRSG